MPDRLDPTLVAHFAEAFKAAFPRESENRYAVLLSQAILLAPPLVLGAFCDYMCRHRSQCGSITGMTVLLREWRSDGFLRETYGADNISWWSSIPQVLVFDSAINCMPEAEIRQLMAALDALPGIDPALLPAK